MDKINVLLGTMTFGEQLFKDDIRELIQKFICYGYDELDTAYVYNNGDSERLIGTVLKEIGRDKIKIDSKVNPRITGRLDADAVRAQLEESLIRLHTDFIDTYYLHFPDKNTPIEPVLEKVNFYYKQGKIRELGLSNFPEELVDSICLTCESNGWLPPTVYEGLYNPLSRKIETGLQDCLARHNMRLNSYNPLAGGLLTDKYTGYFDEPMKGRFTFRPNYRERYWKPTYFEAIDMLKRKCEKYGISITESALRWLANSSILNPQRGDGVIIGVSKAVHLEQNIHYLQKDGLPDEINVAFEDAWRICCEDAPEYYRFYGK